MNAQTIHRPAGINVFGSYLVRVDPDFASLDFAITRTEPNARDAFEKARVAAQAVRAYLSSAGIDERDVQTSQVTLRTATEYVGGRHTPIGFIAHIGIQLVMDQFDRVEAVLAGALEAGANSIERVVWKTTRLRQIRADARAKAFAHARAKAEIYASSAGARLGNVLHIEDLNPETMSRGHSNYVADLDLSDDSAERTATNPGSIVVTAAVMACFAILS
jgi:uncharacterized protein YggE